MIAWWRDLCPKNNQCKLAYTAIENTHYDLTRMSCSTVAYKALEVGGSVGLVGGISDEMAEKLKSAAKQIDRLSGLVAANIIGNAISPNDVQAYAEKILKAQAKQGK